MGMNINEFFEIGNIVRIEEVVYNDKKKNEFYESKVSDIDNDNKKVAIWMPVKKGNLVPLRVGQIIKIIRTHDDGLYYFKAKIENRLLMQQII